jgi:hypothetical protein
MPNRIGAGVGAASRLAAVLAAVIVTVGVAPAPAGAQTELSAEGTITISDAGFGPHTTWTYTDGVDLTCRSSWTGPNGVPQDIKVTCTPGQTLGQVFNCPLMAVSRATASFVGARASCTDTLEMGVGTTGFASADLGPLGAALTCEAYVQVGVLLPPYSVTCAEPGLPTVGSSLGSTVAG